MERRPLGKTGMDVSVLGFGGAEIGYQRAEPDSVKILLNAALDAGLNVIDTAECYTNGDRSSESLIGAAVAGRRDEFYLFTKAGHSAGFDLPDWDARLLEQSIERSLTRLNTDHIDLLQLHSCSEVILRQGYVIETVQRVRESGKIRFLGYSGDNSAARYAVECGAFDTLQTSLSIADQSAIELLPMARERGMGVIAKRPIANATFLYSTRPENSYIAPYWDRLQTLDYSFLSNPEEAASVALRFTLGQEGVHTAIVGTTNPERWKRNARMLEIAGNLSETENEYIRSRWKHAASADWVGLT